MPSSLDFCTIPPYPPPLSRWQAQERFECPSCSKVYCLKCDAPWHGKDSCEDAEEKKKMTPGIAMSRMKSGALVLARV